ncbi:MAG: hypothetical protein H7A51_13850 [Akkermansiaceae bacterium]|nr:hypothetical protein [Akkermansiaceae bacterium]
MEDEITILKLSALRALWGHVSPTLRSASIERTGDTIKWRCVFDTGASEDDLELASMAGTEIIADYELPITIEQEAIITPFPDRVNELEHRIFFRHEHGYYKE